MGDEEILVKDNKDEKRKMGHEQHFPKRASALIETINAPM